MFVSDLWLEVLRLGVLTEVAFIGRQVVEGYLEARALAIGCGAALDRTRDSTRVW